MVDPISIAAGINGTVSDLREGLAQYDTNGVVIKNAAGMGREVRTSLKQMRADIKSLFNLFEDEANTDTFTAPVRIAEDENQVGVYARERLVTMSPRNLLELCRQIGVNIDEAKILELKGEEGDREIRLYHLDDIGVDSEKLREYLVIQKLKRIKILRRSGVEVALVSRNDLHPAPERPTWLQDVTIGSLDQPLESTDTLPRWDVTFREGPIAHRKIVPVFGWAAVGDFSDGVVNYRSLRKKLDFRGGRVNFDEESATLTHFSTVLGAVSLAHEFDISNYLDKGHVYRFFGEGFNHFTTRRHQKRRRQPVPLCAVAALPAILTNFAPDMLTTEKFREAEREAVRLLGKFRVIRGPLSRSVIEYGQSKPLY